MTHIDVISASGAAAAVLIFATLYASQAAAIATFGEVDRATRWTATVAFGVCGAIAVFHLVSALGRFRISEGLAIVIVCSGATRAVTGVPATRVVRLLGEDLAVLVRFLLGGRSALRPLRALVVVAAGQVVARALILPPLAHDSITYHAAKAAFWVQSGGSLPLQMPGSWAVYRYYPWGGEILGAWAMLPFHDDTFYVLVDAMLWLAWLPVVIGLCTELGVPQRVRTALCLYVMTIPAIYYFVPSGHVEVLLHFLLSATMFFCLRAIAAKTPAASACLAVACGLTAITVKITALVPTAIGCAAMLLAARGTPATRGQLARGTAAGAGIGLFTLGPMLLRNIVEQGYPFSPYPLRVLGFTLGVAMPALNWWNNVPPRLLTFENEAIQFARVVGIDGPLWPTFGPPAVPLLLLSAFGLWNLWREKRLAALLVGLFIASQAASYAYPGFAPTRTMFGFCNARLFSLVPMLAALLVSRLWRGRPAQSALSAYFALGSALSIGCYRRLFPSIVELLPLLVLAALGLTALLLGPRIARSIKPSVLGSWALGTLFAALVFASGTLQYYRSFIRYPALKMSAVGYRMPAYLTELAPEIDQPQQPHRIAITTGPQKRATQMLYYFLGSKLQNELVYVSVLPNHAVPVYDRAQPLTPGIDAEAWVTRVRESGASHVLVLDPAWHELDWMRGHPQTFEPVRSTRYSWLFRVHS